MSSPFFYSQNPSLEAGLFPLLRGRVAKHFSLLQLGGFLLSNTHNRFVNDYAAGLSEGVAPVGYLPWVWCTEDLASRLIPPARASASATYTEVPIRSGERPHFCLL